MTCRTSSFPFPLSLGAALALSVLVGCGDQSTGPDTVAPESLTSAPAPAPPGLSKRPSKPPPEEDSFADYLDTYDTSRWMKADGWTNGPPFDNAWSAENVLFEEGEMILRLNDEPLLGEDYSSGHYQTLGFHGYGCYEASFRPVTASGAISSFFTFAGPYDNGGNGLHNEIDIEFVGKSFEEGRSEVQFNFYTNDDSYASQNEQMYALDFDPSAGFNRYGFKWTSTGIAWFVNGEEAYSVYDTSENPTPKASESLQKVMMNLWAVDETAEDWGGVLDYQGAMEAAYQWVRFIRGEDCDLTSGLVEPDPPSPPGEPSGIAVSNISLSLASRDRQVIARVSVIDASGTPVALANVTGAWAGVITNGDTSRDTEPDGVATFYSARTKTSGEVTFCVTDVDLSGSTYLPPEDGEVCASIWK